MKGEKQIEMSLIDKLRELKYTYREDMKEKPENSHHRYDVIILINFHSAKG